ncbi:MAG: group II intron maturase-specific domain-containing protein [Mycobacteriales bacterium]
MPSGRGVRLSEVLHSAAPQEGNHQGQRLHLSVEKIAAFDHGEGAKATFGYLDSFVWHRVTQWLLKRHKRITWAELYRRFLTGRPGNRRAVDRTIMFDAATVPVTRYRWRASNIPTPWTSSAGAPVSA